jgi:hypothetical protein
MRHKLLPKLQQIELSSETKKEIWGAAVIFLFVLFFLFAGTGCESPKNLPMPPPMDYLFDFNR